MYHRHCHSWCTYGRLTERQVCRARCVPLRVSKIEAKVDCSWSNGNIWIAYSNGARSRQNSWSMPISSRVWVAKKSPKIQFGTDPLANNISASWGSWQSVGIFFTFLARRVSRQQLFPRCCRTALSAISANAREDRFKKELKIAGTSRDFPFGSLLVKMMGNNIKESYIFLQVLVYF